MQYLKPSVCKKSSDSFKNIINKVCLQIIDLIYRFKENLALNSLQCLICHKIKANQTEVPFTNFENEFLLIQFDLVGFYGISTIVGYLMPNPVYTYISNIYDF